jgi:CRP/FNR family cyclic AMP-dependent transcriptional regulator
VAGGPELRPGARRHFLDLLEPADRAFLEARCGRAEYHKDALLFQQGEPSGRLVVILTGLVKVSSVTAAGTEAVLAIRGAGDVLGEMSSIDARLRSATVTALNPVTALVLEAAVFEDLLRRPSAGRALLTVVVRRLREADGRRLQFGKTTVTKRVATLLDGLVEYGHRRAGRVVLDMELSQQDLASAVGASRTAVNRSLRELRDQRILTTNRQRVTILRPELLRRTGDQITR